MPQGVDSSEASIEPWLEAKVTRPSKEEVDALARHVIEVAGGDGDQMPEVTALCRQCVRLSKVYACTRTNTRTRTHTRALAHTHSHERTHTHMNARTHTHEGTHTHTHTHT